MFDLMFFHHLREMVGLLWRSRFNLHIYVQWSVVGRPAGCSGMILFSRKKCFDTISGSAESDEHISFIHFQ